ncbi:TetR/AcrR family transcriptional regulator [Actinokineospora bangkokensis]|uniref:TetR family transcriptional regulator n=1 Tax=Actinokineospora bangkokensis TaxID=1193682 RepID=A0A1Q9LNG6_9PSEU|nr:TetR/AcrR family transcriptional regulator [Actinokineospora bangkokensis]OLR93597.1 TetR family transcriptional regulator [Actinokineospora bangkokensis]
MPAPAGTTTSRGCAVGDKGGTPPALRADARRNRAQIIDAARALFLRVGVDVPMEEIAKAAGVGVGTLYRRFPDRAELIKAVSLDNFARLVELAERVEGAEPDPAQALTTLLRSALELRLGITMTALSDRAYRAIQSSPEIDELRDRVMAVAQRLLGRAQAAGTIRADIEIGDTMLALVLVSRLVPPAGDDLAEMVFQRLFALVVDGLRAIPGTPMPGRPVTYEDINELRRSGGLGGFGKFAPADPDESQRAR